MASKHLKDDVIMVEECHSSRLQRKQFRQSFRREPEKGTKLVLPFHQLRLMFSDKTLRRDLISHTSRKPKAMNLFKRLFLASFWSVPLRSKTRKLNAIVLMPCFISATNNSHLLFKSQSSLESHSQVPFHLLPLSKQVEQVINESHEDDDAKHVRNLF